jgi:hypothetical protein
MVTASEIRIEGLAPRELLRMPPEDLDALILERPSAVFSVGTASVLGTFRVRQDRFVVELGHIDGGGEGVLRLMKLLAHAYARQRGLREIEWLIHAVHCPRPNLKLRRVLERRGFRVETLGGVGEVYRLEELVAAS